MSFKKAILAIFFLCICFRVGRTDSKPIMVIELFRHGARAAFSGIWDTSKKWVGQYGELTNAGMRMHYLLGQSVAQDYAHLLKPYDPSQISVFSTDINRTIMSAYSHLYGMYSPGGVPLDDYQSKTALPPGLENYNFSEFITDNMSLPNGVQAVPVHIVSRVRDYALVPRDGCKNFDNVSQLAMNNSAYQEFKTMMNSTTDMIERYAKENNVKLTDIWSYQSLSDTLIANYFENLAFPVNITYESKEWNDLMFYSDWVLTYLYTGQLQILQLSSVNLFAKMFAQLNGKIQGTFNQSFVVHSAHDTTLIAMLATLGLVTSDCLKDVYLGKLNSSVCQFPAYSANIITELYNDANGTAKPYVKFRYNGVYVNVCNTSDYTCSLDAYQKLVNDKLQGYSFIDFQKDCGISSEVKPNGDDSESQRSTLITLIIILGVVCLIELAILLFIILRKGKRVNTTSSEQGQSLIAQP